jgi:flagellar biosynthesis/type III secretory pathway protein FliH
MASIIRATARSGGVQGIAFNFDDLSVEAHKYLEKVRAEAAKILVQAQQEAAAIRKQAERDGQQAALRSVEAIIQRQLATVLPALRQVIEEIRHAKQAWLSRWEAGAVHVAAAIARRVTRRELSRQPEITLDLVREALELAAGSTQLRIHLNPGDHQAMGTQVQMLTKELCHLAEVELVADPEITPGGCRVETRFGAIDQQFEAQLARIEEELT